MCRGPVGNGGGGGGIFELVHPPGNVSLLAKAIVNVGNHVVYRWGVEEEKGVVGCI